jgi:hypothetical protein
VITESRTRDSFIQIAVLFPELLRSNDVPLSTSPRVVLLLRKKSAPVFNVAEGALPLK